MGIYAFTQNHTQKELEIDQKTQLKN